MNSVACPLAQFGRGQAVFFILLKDASFSLQILLRSSSWSLSTPLRSSSHILLSSWMNSVTCPLAQFRRGQAGTLSWPYNSKLHFPHESTLWPAPWPNLAEGRQFYCTFSSHLLFPHLDSAWHLVDRFFMMWCWWALNLMPREASSWWLILQCSLTEPQMRCLSHGWNLSHAPWPHLAEGKQFSLFFIKKWGRLGPQNLTVKHWIRTVSDLSITIRLASNRVIQITSQKHDTNLTKM